MKLVFKNIICYNIFRVIVYKVVASRTCKRREVMQMETYETLSLLFLGGSFLIALLAYIDRDNKRK